MKRANIKVPVNIDLAQFSEIVNPAVDTENRKILRKIVMDFWNDIDTQTWDNLNTYFLDNATINWNNTNEQFNIEEFIIANREYPGSWVIKIERLEVMNNLVISVVKVQLKDDNTSFHATSFFEFENDKIKMLNEYWGSDEIAPQWRLERKIGKAITS